jgi:UDP-glucose 4-epimerase
MEKILITGGLGYLGRRLAERLGEDGAFTVSLLTRGDAKAKPAGGCEVVSLGGSWEDAGAEILSGVGQVVHLGGPDEKQCAADPVGAAHEAFAFTHGLMQQAAKHGVRKVLNASTIHVYGAALHDDVSEQTVPQPAHPYGIIKRICEDVVTAAGLNGGPQSLVLRLANGFGAPVTPDITRWSLLVNDLCRQAVEKRRMTLRSDPRTLRNFVTITDVCEAMLHLLKKDVAGGASLTMNVGSSRSHSIGEMAGLVRTRCREVLGFAPDLEMPAPGAQPVPRLHYDLTQLRETGFVPGEDFAGEIDATLLACARWFGTRD